MKWIYIVLFLLLGCVHAGAQGIRYGVMLDTSYMLIGDQQKLTFTVTSENPVNVSFPQLRDTVVKGLEIISGPLRDSVKEKNGPWTIRETYVITSFDTGVYMIPPMPISIEDPNYNSVYRTDPLGVMVNTFQVNQEEFFDIVMPYAAKWKITEILPYLLYGLGGVLLIILMIWLIRKYRKREPLFREEKPSIPPYVKAIKSLEQLDHEQLWQSGRAKEYYSKLSDTIRTYIEEELQVPAMEQTSYETIRDLEKNKYVDKTDREELDELLKTSDLVKFAKMSPLPDENTKNMQVAHHFLEHVNGRVTEEQKRLQEQKRLKEQEEEKALENNN